MIAACAESALPIASVFPFRSWMSVSSPALPTRSVVNPTSVSRIASTRHVPFVAWWVRAYARFVFHATSTKPASSASTWAS